MLEIEPRTPDVQVFLDEADAAIERLESDAITRFAEFERAEWSDDEWRAQLLEKAIGGDGDVDALIVAGVMWLGQRPDSQDALDALAAVTSTKNGKRRR
ncbi:hypothetical protein FJ950_10380 [Mesorhizobium sp. B2-3-14]|uniref:hypothetical protein n=1 Tax=Mesorhizobium sp. B2-3-14 TaxID=2589950 RepID=UPI00112E9915|nr:hypothetical protein [Mesorhizobium sp. B2-3-14]TPL86799.1 hypothetical protein FJ950_10380 [Mesorhizobium sp. B2-3-14]